LLIDVAVIQTGTANLASVCGGLSRAGASVRAVDSPADIAGATHLVLPGVGSFGAAMTGLRDRQWPRLIREWIGDDRPLLAVCVGLQVLFESSEESPMAAGLAILGGAVERIADSAVLATPHMGWNDVQVEGESRLIRSGRAYFANSYCARRAIEADAIGTTCYGGPFLAAFERGKLLACQFHPELSGPYGLDLMTRWLNAPPCDARAVRALDPRLSELDSTKRLPTRIIPCLDVRNGRVVKGVKFQNLRDAGDPVECARMYEAQGADELVILDVSATGEGRRACLETVRAVRAILSIPLTVGGGVRGRDDAACLLSAGADKVSINTAAVADPNLLATMSGEFGRQCTVVAIDAARSAAVASGFEVVTHAGTERTGIDAVCWARDACDRGAGELLLTSLDRDGTREGYDLELLRVITAEVSVPVIASGGAASPAHLAAAVKAGADAVLAASIFHDREITVSQVKGELAALGLSIRC